MLLTRLESGLFWNLDGVDGTAAIVSLPRVDDN